MFNPGETVTHAFTIPFIAEDLTKVIVSYKQGDEIVLEKSITSGFEEADVPTKTKFYISLNQAESLLFRDWYKIKIQINVFIDKDGRTIRAASREMEAKSGVQYYREVISNA